MIALLTDAKHLSAVDKSAFADINLGESAWAHAQYRHIVVCGGLYAIQNDSARDIVLPPELSQPPLYYGQYIRVALITCL